ncbi:hypothetical protein L7F22_054497, partial [Adiantum nelumboides]|nr:hypothetical protein [Adiantum nelumboides]
MLNCLQKKNGNDMDTDQNEEIKVINSSMEDKQEEISKKCSTSQGASIGALKMQEDTIKQEEVMIVEQIEQEK